MVAIAAETIRKIKMAQPEVEKYIMNMIKISDASNCPYRLLKEGYPDSPATREVVTSVARILYKTDLLERLDISLSDQDSYEKLLYAFGYWGGQTLYRHGERICKCSNKCY